MHLEDHLDEGVITGSDEFFLGQGEREQAKDSLRPSEAQVRGQVVPALKRALDKERSNDILTGAMIALAGYYRLKAGQTEPEIIRAKPRWPMKELDPLPTAAG